MDKQSFGKKVSTRKETEMKNVMTHKGTVVQDPPLAQFLFNDTRASLIWLVLRVWLGYRWIDAALHKINEPAWVQTGEALKGFWTGAIAIPEGGRAPIAFEWYRSFIQFLLDTEAYTWFAKVVAYGELLVGIALVIGLFTGIAAFFGGFMNWNFIMAGSASANGLMFFVAVLLILAWKVSGYIGLDYFALPYLGTPWRTRTVESPPVRTAPTD
jgi:thiosulfate dehydrogenase [quinone] large subunit